MVTIKNPVSPIMHSLFLTLHLGLKKRQGDALYLWTPIFKHTVLNSRFYWFKIEEEWCPRSYATTVYHPNTTGQRRNGEEAHLSRGEVSGQASLCEEVRVSRLLPYCFKSLLVVRAAPVKRWESVTFLCCLHAGIFGFRLYGTNAPVRSNLGRLFLHALSCREETGWHWQNKSCV